MLPLRATLTAAAVPVLMAAVTLVFGVPATQRSVDARAEVAAPSARAATLTLPTPTLPTPPVPLAGTEVDSRSPSAAPPGLGPRTAAAVPATSSQLVVVSGSDGSRATVTAYRRDGAGWTPDLTWPGVVGAAGWSPDRTDGSLATPAGVFSLSDAGGRLEDPGTALPYSRSGEFVADGRGVDGESLEGAFDYVLAIDFNRVRGRSPLDEITPQGPGPGSGIWFHVDHGGRTRGCVSLSLDGMRQLLRWLDPAAHPMVAMGPAPFLAG